MKIGRWENGQKDDMNIGRGKNGQNDGYKDRQIEAQTL